MSPMNDPDEVAVLSPARLGEALAWLAYFPAGEKAEVLRCLGSTEESFERNAAETRSLLSARLAEGDPGPTLDFARAFDLTDRRARARRPAIAGIRLAVHLEPDAGGR